MRNADANEIVGTSAINGLLGRDILEAAMEALRKQENAHNQETIDLPEVKRLKLPKRKIG
ncbi:MAG: hypothetical protein M1835_003334, partial [Candelina submexicana]